MINAVNVAYTSAQDLSIDQTTSDTLTAQQWSEEFTVALESKINAVIASCVQGSSEALHILVPLVLTSINAAIAQLQLQLQLQIDPSADMSIQPATPSSDPDVTPAPTALFIDVWRAAALIALSKLLDPVVLGEKIKSLAKRTPYGIRSGVALAFENTDLFSLWRWEILR